jgi:hypothetical protein
MHRFLGSIALMCFVSREQSEQLSVFGKSNVAHWLAFLWHHRWQEAKTEKHDNGANSKLYLPNHHEKAPMECTLYHYCTV